MIFPKSRLVLPVFHGRIPLTAFPAEFLPVAVGDEGLATFTPFPGSPFPFGSNGQLILNDTSAPSADRMRARGATGIPINIKTQQGAIGFHVLENGPLKKAKALASILSDNVTARGTAFTSFSSAAQRGHLQGEGSRRDSKRPRTQIGEKLIFLILSRIRFYDERPRF